jgi:hypothetical protein
VTFTPIPASTLALETTEGSELSEQTVPGEIEVRYPIRISPGSVRSVYVAIYVPDMLAAVDPASFAIVPIPTDAPSVAGPYRPYRVGITIQDTMRVELVAEAFGIRATDPEPRKKVYTDQIGRRTEWVWQITAPERQDTYELIVLVYRGQDVNPSWRRIFEIFVKGPTPTPSPTMTPTDTRTPSATPTHTVAPSATPSNTVTPSATPTTPTPTATWTPTPTPTSAPTPAVPGPGGPVLIGIVVAVIVLAGGLAGGYVLIRSRAETGRDGLVEPGQRTTIAYLSPDTITKLVETITEVDMADKDARELLLSGIDKGYASTLPVRDNPRDQILSDLHEINRVPSLADGEIPLLIWLQNARDNMRLSHRTEEAVFQSALEQVEVKARENAAKTRASA